MASQPNFHFNVHYCSNCGKESIDGYCEWCEEEVAELPSLEEYDVFDETDDE